MAGAKLCRSLFNEDLGQCANQSTGKNEQECALPFGSYLYWSLNNCGRRQKWNPVGKTSSPSLKHRAPMPGYLSSYTEDECQRRWFLRRWTI